MRSSSYSAASSYICTFMAVMYFVLVFVSPVLCIETYRLSWLCHGKSAHISLWQGIMEVRVSLAANPIPGLTPGLQVVPATSTTLLLRLCAPIQSSGSWFDALTQCTSHRSCATCERDWIVLGFPPSRRGETTLTPPLAFLLPRGLCFLLAGLDGKGTVTACGWTGPAQI